jgi:hypothetical protein
MNEVRPEQLKQISKILTRLAGFPTTAGRKA